MAFIFKSKTYFIFSKKRQTKRKLMNKRYEKISHKYKKHHVSTKKKKNSEGSHEIKYDKFPKCLHPLNVTAWHKVKLGPTLEPSCS